jgi:hypothetical protein
MMETYFKRLNITTNRSGNAMKTFIRKFQILTLALAVIAVLGVSASAYAEPEKAGNSTPSGAGCGH